MTTDEEILKDYEKRIDTDFSDLITTYSEEIIELMTFARQDERNTLRNGIESGYTCVKAGCTGEAAACVPCINKELEKARQDEARKIFAELEKPAGVVRGWFSVPIEYYENLKKKFGVSSSSDDKPPAKQEVE